LKISIYLRITLIAIVAIIILIAASYFGIKEFLSTSLVEIAVAEKERMQFEVGDAIANEMPTKFETTSHYNLVIYSSTVAMDHQMTILVDGDNQRLKGSMQIWPADVPQEDGKHPYNGVSAGLPEGEYIAHVMALDIPTFDTKAFRSRVRDSVAFDRAELYAQSVTSVLATIAKVLMWVIIGVVLMYFILGKSFKKRLAQIEQTLSRFSDGQLTSRLPKQHTSKSDELGLLGQRVNTMLDKTERLVSGLDRMTSQISHELKDELSSLEKNLAAASATLVSERVGAMRNLVDEILELVRLESDADEQSEVFYLADPVIEALQVYSDSFEDAGIRLELTDLSANSGPRILGRPSLITRLVANLLSNILRYAANSQQVNIDITINGQLAILSIADEGPGLPVDDVDQLAKEARRRPDGEGYGAGLRFVRAVAIRHGGNVELNTMSKGLVVSIRLPIRE